MTLVVWGLMI